MCLNTPVPSNDTARIPSKTEEAARTFITKTLLPRHYKWPLSHLEDNQTTLLENFKGNLIRKPSRTNPLKTTPVTSQRACTVQGKTDSLVQGLRCHFTGAQVPQCISLNLQEQPYGFGKSRFCSIRYLRETAEVLCLCSDP